MREVYFKAGVPEYWLIDACREQIDFRMLVRGEDGYQAVEADADGYLSSPVFGASFLLTRRLDPLGEFEYRLLQR